eukprot:COSAG02_NODE_12497_length_1536_cov_1.940153_1_plen_24_part_10
MRIAHDWGCLIFTGEYLGRGRGPN